jgi:hypothetical protein
MLLLLITHNMALDRQRKLTNLKSLALTLPIKEYLRQYQGRSCCSIIFLMYLDTAPNMVSGDTLLLL